MTLDLKKCHVFFFAVFFSGTSCTLRFCLRGKKDFESENKKTNEFLAKKSREKLAREEDSKKNVTFFQIEGHKKKKKKEVKKITDRPSILTPVLHRR
jgi:hypothetical protein